MNKRKELREMYNYNSFFTLESQLLVSLIILDAIIIRNFCIYVSKILGVIIYSFLV